MWRRCGLIVVMMWIAGCASAPAHGPGWGNGTRYSSMETDRDRWLFQRMLDERDQKWRQQKTQGEGRAYRSH